MKLRKKADSNKNKEVPLYNLSIDLSELSLKLKKEQYDCMFKILTMVIEYNQFLLNQYDCRKYRPYRPKFGILDPRKEFRLVDKSVKNENARLWFKFAINMTIKKLRVLKGKK